MSAHIETVFVLLGAFAGKTITLGTLPYNFVNGRFSLRATPEDTALVSRALERNWQAFPEGHPKIQEFEDGQRNLHPDGEQPVQSEIQPEGERTSPDNETTNSEIATENTTGTAEPVSIGDGQPAVLVAEPNKKLLKAVMKLDPVNEAHWTQDGKPAIAAVASLYGASDVTRADIEAVAENYRRPAVTTS